MLEIVESGGSPALLKVFGVGGGGSNAVNRMIQSGLRDVEFWVSNTDLQALELSTCHNRLPIGKNTTRGLGAGGDPEIGRLSAEEDAEEIEKIIEGADMVFITAGMGGGTGTGAAPVIARIARELGVLTVGIVTKPFSFEGKKKLARARRGLEALSEQVDTLISIPNDKLMQIVEPGTSFDDALLMADDVLLQATRGISDLIMGHGIINLDFADVRTVMRGRGNALLGSGAASGEGRALEAAQKAVSSPLLEDLAIEGAEAVLVNIQGGPGMGFHEAAQAAQFVSDQVGEEADVFWGAVVDPTMEDEIRVTLVATGFPESKTPEPVAVRTTREDPATAPIPAGEGANGQVGGPPRDRDGGRLPEGGTRTNELREEDPAPVGSYGSDPVARDDGRVRETREGNGVHEGASGARAERRPAEDSRPPASREPAPSRRPEAQPGEAGRRQRLEESVSAARPRSEHPRGEVERSDRMRRAQDPRAERPHAEDARPTDRRPAGPPGEVDRRPEPERGRTEVPSGPRESRPESDRQGSRPAEGGRLPERKQRGPAESIAVGAEGLESELFLPPERTGGSDPGLRRSRWASSDPEWTEGDELDRATAKKRPLDVPTYLRKRMD